MQKFELTAESHHQHMRVTAAPGISLVTADLDMMERVLTNLLDNALRHTPEHGLIEIEMTQQVGKVQVQVNDSGQGIAAELREDLFVRPSLLNARRHRARGMGLMIVRRILQLHDSDIKLGECQQRGAFFQFFVPSVKEGAGGGLIEKEGQLLQMWA
ncbi:ATP-binding protein [Candidatus Erwinia dacicola]|nr:ATP-binding protein [Candidatus Erwinia dacicola]